MDRKQKREKIKRFEQMLHSKIVGAEVALAFVLKEETIEIVSFDPKGITGEVFMLLASKPDFYAVMKLAVKMTDSPDGEKLFEETVQYMNKDLAIKPAKEKEDNSCTACPHLYTKGELFCKAAGFEIPNIEVTPVWCPLKEKSK